MLTADLSLGLYRRAGYARRSTLFETLYALGEGDKLQNPENKREILSDERLQAVFAGKSKVSMFEMNKYFAQHLS